MYLISGAGGGVGSISRTVVELPLDAGEPVRAIIGGDDERAQQLRAGGADVVIECSEARRRHRRHGRRRMSFTMSVSADHLPATAEVCAVALEHGHLKATVNMSQMTVADDADQYGASLHVSVRTGSSSM